MPTVEEIIDQHGGYGHEIVQAADKIGLPYPVACGLVEQESGFQNIFGCDWRTQPGHVPFCHEQFVKWKVEALIEHVKRGGV